MATSINFFNSNAITGKNPFQDMIVTKPYVAIDKGDNLYVIVIRVSDNFIIFKQNSGIHWVAPSSFMKDNYILIGELNKGDSFTYTVDN